MTDSQVYTDAALLGTMAGMRSLSAPALVSGLTYMGLLPLANKQLELLARPASVVTLGLLAGGEVIADKLPFVPARIKPGPLAVRAISGAMCGAAVTSAKQRSTLFGALIGACTAVASTYGAYYLRRSAGESSGIPDPALAIVEDALVVTAGWLLVKSLCEVAEDYQTA